MNPEESKITEETGVEPPETPVQEVPKKETPKKTAPQRRSKSRPVTVYLVVLFVVALLLLVMSFFMQQRSHQAIEDLNKSMITSQDAATLQMDKQRLEFDLQKAQEDLTEAEASLANLEKQAQALEWLRQMEAAVRTSYTDLKTLVEKFEESGLVDYLPTESVVEGAEAPADAYRDIYAMIY